MLAAWSSLTKLRTLCTVHPIPPPPQVPRLRTLLPLQHLAHLVLVPVPPPLQQHLLPFPRVPRSPLMTRPNGWTTLLYTHRCSHQFNPRCSPQDSLLSVQGCPCGLAPALPFLLLPPLPHQLRCHLLLPLVPPPPLGPRLTLRSPSHDVVCMVSAFIVISLS